jgi:hypothetical protein
LDVLELRRFGNKGREMSREKRRGDLGTLYWYAVE